MANAVIRRFRDISLTGKLYFVVGIMAFLIVLELFMLWFTMHSLSSLRGYVGAEGLWSKAEKDATFHLYKYTVEQKEVDYQKFIFFLKTSQGDHKARMEMLKPKPDYDTAFYGFYQGRVHPQDIDGMLKLFRRFHSISYIEKAIVYWSKGDSLMQELINTSVGLHQKIIQNHLTAAEASVVRNRISDLNEKLTIVEDNFSSILGEGSRWLENLVLKILLLTALFVEFSGLVLSISISGVISRGIDEIIHVTNEVANSNFKIRARVDSRDEMGYLGKALNSMIDQLEESIDLRIAAQRDLQQKNQETRNILDSAYDAFILIDEESKVLDWNKQAEVVFGWRREEAIGRDVLQILIPHEQREAYKEEMQGFLKKGESELFNKRLEVNALRKNKSEFPLELIIIPLKNEDKFIFSAFMRDITEKKKVERALLKEQKFLTAVLENTVAGIVACNEKGELTLLNRAMKDMLGLSPEASLKPKEWASTYKLYDADGSTLLKTAEVPLYRAFHGEFVKNAEFVVASKNKPSRTLLASGQPIIDNEAKKLGAVVVIHDISDLRESENALREREELYRTVVESLTEGLIITDHEDKVMFVNKRVKDIVGYSEEELIGNKAYEKLSVPEDWPFIRQKLEERLEGKPERYETLVLKKDGTQTWVEISGSPFRDSSGKVIGTVGAISDISEKKATQVQIEEYLKELEETNKELNRFGYIVSHDLKAPLRAIGSLVSWLNVDFKDKLGEEGAKTMEMLSGRVQRMHQLIEGILEYSRIGRSEERYEPIALTPLLKEITEMLGPPENIKVKIPKNLPTVYFDRIRMTQIFQNLIGNAIKFRDKPVGLVTISVKEETTHWQFSVCDNGPGIDVRHQGKVFEIFQTLKPRDEFESTGIGLTIVKKIIESYRGGRIWIESQSGNGACFHFTFNKEA